jgi:hypothetical protein
MPARAPEIVACLSKQPAGEMTGPARVLYDLMLTFVETAHPIERLAVSRGQRCALYLKGTAR